MADPCVIVDAGLGETYASLSSLRALLVSAGFSGTTMKRLIAAMEIAVVMITLANTVLAAEIKVIASPAIKVAYLQLIPEFERISQHRVLTVWGPTVEIMRRVTDGEAADLVIMAADSIDELAKLGKIVPGSRADVAKSGIGVAVRAGDPSLDISSAEAFKRALLSARSIAISTGPSGVYLVGLFGRMGIADALRPQIRQVQGEPIGAVVARGEAEIGFQQVSELLPVAGIDFLGPLPPDVQQITIFTAGIHLNARQPDAARSLVQFLISPQAAPVIKKSGMEPG